MRITRLPIPLIIAAAALTGVAVIYVYLQAPPMPIYTDPNFTQPLYGGVTYLWRGAAFQYIFSSDYPISITNGTAYHLIYLYGPLYNISLAERAYVLYGAGIRPLYVIKLNVVDQYGNRIPGACLTFRLTDVTPNNMPIANLTMYLPTPFGQNDLLTNKEDSAVYSFVDCTAKRRVIDISVNGTHIIYRVMYTTSASGDTRFLVRLPPAIDGRTIRVTNQPIRTAYVVGGSTFSAMALPYLHFAITPSQTTTLTIYVS